MPVFQNMTIWRRLLKEVIINIRSGELQTPWPSNMNDVLIAKDWNILRGKPGDIGFQRWLMGI